MESVRFTAEERDSGQRSIADVANIEDKVAKLFERFKLDLEEIFRRSAQNGSLNEVTHRTRRRRLR